MTFTTFHYFLFLPAVYLAFSLTADQWRWLVLLIASYGFYASLRAPYLLCVLFLVTVVSYGCGLRIAAHTEESARRRWLWIGSTLSLSILAVLKYLPLLEPRTTALLGHDGSTALITVGVSYFTFQAISYQADVYLEVTDAERHFGRYALYISFFPKLLQGPIERAGELLPQLRQPYRFDYDAARYGMLMFTWGLFKKIALADRFAIYANEVFSHPDSYSGLSLLLGVYAYAFQIYFDFSGYTDMARGTASLFGITLTENFKSPYRATSIAEFWRRWHISFSSWILQYLFRPLQMQWRQWGSRGTALALLVTFFISGIWHGATWGFVIWGGLHGLYLAASTYYRPHQKKLHRWLGIDKSAWKPWWQVAITFNLVCFSWIFFRASSVAVGLAMVRNLFSGVNLAAVKGLLALNGLVNAAVLVCAVLLYCLLNGSVSTGTVLRAGAVRRWCVYLTAVVGLLLLGSFHSSAEFVYFQF